MYYYFPILSQTLLPDVHHHDRSLGANSNGGRKRVQSQTPIVTRKINCGDRHSALKAVAGFFPRAVVWMISRSRGAMIQAGETILLVLKHWHKTCNGNALDGPLKRVQLTSRSHENALRPSSSYVTFTSAWMQKGFTWIVMNRQSWNAAYRPLDQTASFAFPQDSF